ncbi:hypothetical protein BC938DRAFT_475994 [Jimgerdemannia flammicorona]|uniref:Uncharacterized protein n=1 Tax=Jimgerdemannia flammicorona TaxID=994334 RepID=A0A433PLS3_9FUNG|nr:hypothetical protein BC938DRAFT_475994 [Jimgerdemannia flammicorona]
MDQSLSLSPPPRLRPFLEDILPTETLETLINEYKLSPIAAITPRWVLKYSVIIASRGVVADKG